MSAWRGAGLSRRDYERAFVAAGAVSLKDDSLAAERKRGLVLSYGNGSPRMRSAKACASNGATSFVTGTSSSARRRQRSPFRMIIHCRWRRGRLTVGWEILSLSGRSARVVDVATIPGLPATVPRSAWRRAACRREIIGPWLEDRTACLSRSVWSANSAGFAPPPSMR